MTRTETIYEIRIIKQIDPRNNHILCTKLDEYQLNPIYQSLYHNLNINFYIFINQ